MSNVSEVEHLFSTELTMLMTTFGRSNGIEETRSNGRDSSTVCPVSRSTTHRTPKTSSGIGD
ncbi:hypothetical protein G4B88_022177 [Cannabis sativa]|uniref:Uncharacterized protein n=1 Tax=Cannabis sativa TaxID=3483 RepID=A0A7J6FGF9_CANSA|nr:hypothetical protein G4B88_022177 [Cannabis sativa]